MKSRLALLYGKTRTFTAMFDRIGTRKNYQYKQQENGQERIPTMLLTNVCDTKGNELADHIWVRDITQFLDYEGHFIKGQRFRFKGLVDNFAKGSFDEDFHIVAIDKVKPMRPKKEKKAA